ncbi:MAG: hypothetical protein PHQ60_09185 [Sideroxydans sp.]|nr:hypothetical protein [Sideroxydans sp.]
MTNTDDTNCVENSPKKTWEKPEISELKTSLTEAKGGAKTNTGPENLFTSPS